VGNKARVLVVEDESISARAIMHMVEVVGCEVVGVLDRAEDALTSVVEQDADLVLMDVRLKGEMSGIEAARLIRGRYGTPVVLVTAYSSNELHDHYGLGEGFPYLTKPVEEHELASVVDEVLGARPDERQELS